jgi:hypothetical protein
VKNDRCIKASSKIIMINEHKMNMRMADNEMIREIEMLKQRPDNLPDNLLQEGLFDTADATNHIAFYIACNQVA